VRTPKLTAGYAIGPAFGHYKAAPPGGLSAVLTPMACADDEIECPDGSCCAEDQWCHEYAAGRYVCRNYPPAPPPSPERPGTPPPGPGPVLPPGLAYGNGALAGG
jgi:hypothetical protein